MASLNMDFAKPQKPEYGAAALGTMLGLIANGLASKHEEIVNARKEAQKTTLTNIIPQGGEDAARAYSQLSGVPITPGSPEKTTVTKSADQQAQEYAAQNPANGDPTLNVPMNFKDITQTTPATKSTIPMGGRDYALADFPSSGKQMTEQEKADAAIIKALNVKNTQGAIGSWGAVKDEMGNTTGYVNNKTLEVKPISQVSGFDTGSMGRGLEASQTRASAEFAPKVTFLAKKVLDKIDNLKSQLGPLGGRWSDLVTGKIGANNPEMAAFYADAKLLPSAIAKMHYGARGGTETTKGFEQMIGAKFQDPENMKAILKEAIDYANEVSGVNKESGNKIPQETKSNSDPLGLGIQ